MSKPSINPLTPALSPSDSPRCRAVAAGGERENRRQSVGKTGAVGRFGGHALLFPLPIGWGEGQDEGLLFNPATNP